MVPSLVLSEAVLLLVLVLDVKISLRRPSLGVACVRPGVRGRKSRPEHNGEYEYRCAEYEYEMPGETRNARGITTKLSCPPPRGRLAQEYTSSERIAPNAHSASGRAAATCYRASFRARLCHLSGLLAEWKTPSTNGTSDRIRNWTRYGKRATRTMRTSSNATPYVIGCDRTLDNAERTAIRNRFATSTEISSYHAMASARSFGTLG